MSIKKKLILLYSTSFIILFLLGTLTLLMLRNQESLNKSQQNRHESHLLADELRQSSDDLTRMARSYVVTKDEKYEKRYWEILDIRNGKKPRPDGRTLPLRKVMEDMGFAREEFAKISEAEDNSNSLVATEAIAMNAVKGVFDDGTGNFVKQGEPDLELARRIMFDEKYHQDKSIIMKPIADFMKMLDYRTESTANMYVRNGNMFLLMMLGMLGLFAIFSGFAYAITTVSVIKPIGVMAAMLENIAEGEGDLSRHLDIQREDEIGELATWFNKFVVKLRKIIWQLSENTDSLYTSSEEMSSISTEMASSAKEMESQSDAVASSSEQVAASVGAVASVIRQVSASIAGIADMTGEMSANFSNVVRFGKKTADNVTETAQSCQDISAQISNVASALEQMILSLNEVAKSTAHANRISQEANQSAERINIRIDTLVSSSGKIGKIVGIIKDIADQTNMLALNAKIEAAGAGDAGKGFAIVAGEVKELARQTAKSSDEIAEQIEEIQTSTDGVVQAKEEIIKVISGIAGINETIAGSADEQTAAAGEISKSVTVAATTLKSVAENANESAKLVEAIAKSTDKTSGTAAEIAGNIDELLNSVKDIARSSDEVAHGINDISKNIQGVSDASKQTALGASQTNASSNELAEMASSLSQIVRKFKLN